MQGLHATARAILGWQCGLACLAAVIFVPQGGHAVLASLAGSAIAIVPTAVTYWRVFVALSRVGARSPETFVRLVNRAHAMRQVLTLLLFAMAMAQAAEQFVQIMTGFVVCLAAYWCVAGRGLIDKDSGNALQNGQRKE
ncbi:MAG: hypothetical protein ACPHCJ_04140 [Oceanococcaceae bacterium]